MTKNVTTKTVDASAAPQPDGLVSVPCKIRTSRSVKISGETETSSSSEEIIEILKFATQPAVVKVSIPLKITRNYQSIGIEIGIERPCYVEELEKCFILAESIVTERLAIQIPNIEQLLDNLIDKKDSR